MVDKFEVGKVYRLREDYPLRNGKHITFENRNTYWAEDKYSGFKNQMCRECESCGNILINGEQQCKFSNVNGGEWNYFIADFVEAFPYGKEKASVLTRLGLIKKNFVCKTKEESWEIQKVLFDLGFKWLHSKRELQNHLQFCVDSEQDMCKGREPGFNTLTFEDVFKNTNNATYSVENKMELKKIKKVNLAIAKKQFETEKKNAEVEFALREYREAVDNVDRIDRDIKNLEEKRLPYEATIVSFGK